MKQGISGVWVLVWDIMGGRTHIYQGQTDGITRLNMTAALFFTITVVPTEIIPSIVLPWP